MEVTTTRTRYSPEVGVDAYGSILLQTPSLHNLSTLDYIHKSLVSIIALMQQPPRGTCHCRWCHESLRRSIVDATVRSSKYSLPQ